MCHVTRYPKGLIPIIGSIDIKDKTNIVCIYCTPKSIKDYQNILFPSVIL